MKKGFTLVEMLAVISLLALVALVIVPATEAVINGVKKDNFEAQKETLISALKVWSADHVLNMPDDEGDYIETNVGQLKKEGFLEVEFKDPRDDKCINNILIIKIQTESNLGRYKECFQFAVSVLCENMATRRD